MCKRESASCCLPFPLFVHFSFSPIKFSATDFSASMSQSSNLLCTLRVAKYIAGQKTKMLRFIFTFSFHVSFFHLSLHIIHRETCVKDFSGPTAPRIWKPGINVGCDLYRVKENQHAAAYHSLYLPIFLYLQANFLASMRATVFKFCMHIESGQVYCGTENKLRCILPSFSFFPSLTPM